MIFKLFSLPKCTEHDYGCPLTLTKGSLIHFQVQFLSFTVFVCFQNSILSLFSSAASGAGMFPNFSTMLD